MLVLDLIPLDVARLQVKPQTLDGLDMSYFAQISEVIEAEWSLVKPVRVGCVPATLRTPDLHVTVTRDGVPTLRVDIYAYGPDCFAFREALVWRENLVVGFGSHVHAISLANRSTVTVPLDAYFGHLYATSEYLLIASGERLFRMDPDRSVLWRSDLLAIDGVVVQDTGPPVVRGEAERDPPGGWEPFAVFAADGRASP